MESKLKYKEDYEPEVRLIPSDVYQLLMTAPEELDHQLATRILCSLKGEAGLEQTYAYLLKKFPNKVPRSYICRLDNTRDSKLPKAIKSDPRTFTEKVRAKALGKLFGKN